MEASPIQRELGGERQSSRFEIGTGENAGAVGRVFWERLYPGGAVAKGALLPPVASTVPKKRRRFGRLVAPKPPLFLPVNPQLPSKFNNTKTLHPSLIPFLQ